MQIQNTLWIQIHTNQDWIGIAPREESLHILCSNKIPRNVKIYQNFILHLKPDCTAVSDTTTLKPENLLRDKIETHKTIHLIDKESINKTLAKYQLTDIPTDLIKEIHINPEKLQTLEKTLEEQHSRQNIKTRKNYHMERKIHALSSFNRIYSPWLYSACIPL